MKEFDTGSKAHCARGFIQGHISTSLIDHKGLMMMMMMVKAPCVIPECIEEALSGFLTHCGPASWAASCYQSLLSVQSE